MKKSRILLASAAVSVALAGLAAPAGAQTFTSLKEPACKGAPGNAAARNHDHGSVIYTCAGAAGWRIKLTYFGVNVGAEFSPAGAGAPVFTLRAPFDIGPRIEWRATGKSAQPHAAIVRLHVRTSSQKTASALAVLGVSPSAICLAGIAQTNEAAQAMAAGLADGKCPGAVRLTGGETETVRELIELNQ